MVMQGQYLERPTVIPSGDLYLEGLFHRGDRGPGVLILSPPAPGGSPMEVPIVAELAWAMHRAQRPTLRFNLRGYGASQGERGAESTQLVDAAAALQTLRESCDEGVPLAVIGIRGSGALAVDLVQRAGGLGALVLLAPPAELHARLESGVPPTLVSLPEADPWPGVRGRQGKLLVEEVLSTDRQFLRGLPLFGQAITQFLDAL